MLNTKTVDKLGQVYMNHCLTTSDKKIVVIQRQYLKYLNENDRLLHEYYAKKLYITTDTSLHAVARNRLVRV